MSSPLSPGPPSGQPESVPLRLTPTRTFLVAGPLTGIACNDSDASETDSQCRHGQPQKECRHASQLGHFAPLLATAATAVAVVFAPIATAAPSQGAAGAGGPAAPSDSGQTQQSCLTLGGTASQCQSPGNAQVYDAPPQVDYFPYAGGGT